MGVNNESQVVRIVMGLCAQFRKFWLLSSTKKYIFLLIAIFTRVSHKLSMNKILCFKKYHINSSKNVWNDVSLKLQRIEYGWQMTRAGPTFWPVQARPTTHYRRSDREKIFGRSARPVLTIFSKNLKIKILVTMHIATRLCAPLCRQPRDPLFSRPLPLKIIICVLNLDKYFN